MLRFQRWRKELEVEGTEERWILLSPNPFRQFSASEIIQHIDLRISMLMHSRGLNSTRGERASVQALQSMAKKLVFKRNIRMT